MARKKTSRKKAAAKTRMGAGPARKRRSARGRRRRTRKWNFPWGKLLVFFLIIGAAYTAFLDLTIRRQFEGKRWELPARVFARPLELYSGAPLDAGDFAAELRRLHYQKVSTPELAGEFSRAGTRFELVTRPFTVPEGSLMARHCGKLPIPAPVGKLTWYVSIRC